MSKRGRTNRDARRIRSGFSDGGTANPIDRPTWSDVEEYFFNVVKNDRFELIYLVLQKSILGEYRIVQNKFGNRDRVLALDNDPLSLVPIVIKILRSQNDHVEFKSSQKALPY